MAGAEGAGGPTRSSLLGPDSRVDLKILPARDERDAPVHRLTVVVPHDGLSEGDVRRCTELAGVEVHPRPPGDGDGHEGVRYVTWTDPVRSGAAAARTFEQGQRTHVYLPALPQRAVRQFVVGMMRGAYRVRRSDPPVQAVLLLRRPGNRGAAEEGLAIGRGVLLARDLANEPSNSKDPRWMADRAAEVAGPGLDLTVVEAPELADRGFGGLTAVGSGSRSAPLMIRLDYDGGAGPRAVLVGKGITFDSGGLSLKPPASMPLMKTDMTGAAAVLGAMAAVRELGLGVRITALLACAENMPGGAAMRPGDVVRHFGGRTTEVLNTDAEGRLVLADCLAYAAEELEPDYLVDLASLTGAATVGLGRQHAALYGDDGRLVGDLIRAGEAGGEGIWRMPLVEQYRAAIRSDVADAANTNTDPHIAAGSITAALFLQPFAAGRRWAHLDIAGAARAEAERVDTRKGATGYGVSLLVSWLARLSGKRW